MPRCCWGWIPQRWAHACGCPEAGLAAAGREVWTLGLSGGGPLVDQFQAAGGLMVSASHNPEDNGIKLFGPSGARLNRDQQQAIEAGCGEVRPALTSCGPAAAAGAVGELHRLAGEQPEGRRLDGRRIVLDLLGFSHLLRGSCSAVLVRR